jgi:hypothetical protein
VFVRGYCGKGEWVGRGRDYGGIGAGEYVGLLYNECDVVPVVDYFQACIGFGKVAFLVVSIANWTLARCGLVVMKQNTDVAID